MYNLPATILALNTIYIHTDDVFHNYERYIKTLLLFSEKDDEYFKILFDELFGSYYEYIPDDEVGREYFNQYISPRRFIIFCLSITGFCTEASKELKNTSEQILNQILDRTFPFENHPQVSSTLEGGRVKQKGGISLIYFIRFVFSLMVYTSHNVFAYSFARLMDIGIQLGNNMGDEELISSEIKDFFNKAPLIKHHPISKMDGGQLFYGTPEEKKEQYEIIKKVCNKLSDSTTIISNVWGLEDKMSLLGETAGMLASFIPNQYDSYGSHTSMKVVNNDEIIINLQPSMKQKITLTLSAKELSSLFSGDNAKKIELIKKTLMSFMNTNEDLINYKTLFGALNSLTQHYVKNDAAELAMAYLNELSWTTLQIGILSLENLKRGANILQSIIETRARNVKMIVSNFDMLSGFARKTYNIATQIPTNTLLAVGILYNLPTVNGGPEETPLMIETQATHIQLTDHLSQLISKLNEINKYTHEYDDDNANKLPGTIANLELHQDVLIKNADYVQHDKNEEEINRLRKLHDVIKKDMAEATSIGNKINNSSIKSNDSSHPKNLVPIQSFEKIRIKTPTFRKIYSPHPTSKPKPKPKSPISIKRLGTNKYSRRKSSRNSQLGGKTKKTRKRKKNKRKKSKGKKSKRKRRCRQSKRKRKNNLLI